LLGFTLAAGATRAATTTVHAAFDGDEPQMPDRLRRDGSPTTCAMEAFPGDFPGPSQWQRFQFCNSGPETCFTATFDEGDCGDDVHIMAYVNSFDPNHLEMNYAGDVGASDSLPFSFVVPAGAQFFIVAQTNFGMADCSFSFTVNAMRCATPAPLLSQLAILLAVGALSIVAGAAIRRTRQTLATLMLCAVIAVFAGPAAALLAAEPTAASSRACALSCGAAYRACATERCDSSAMDSNPDCLRDCQREHQLCLQACS
jgi:hypothetical protein